MKAPDVIYVEFSEDANLAFEQQPFVELLPTFAKMPCWNGLMQTLI